MPPRKKAIVVETNINMTESIQPLTSDPPVLKPKKEKKTSKHKVVALITPDGIQGTFQSESKRPLIAHLPIHSSEIQFHDQPFTYDPRPPEQFEAFNAADIDPFSEEATYENAPKKDEKAQEAQEEPEIEQTKNQKQKTVQPIPQTVRKEYGPTTLLVQYANTKHTHELPQETNLACFWCCDGFKGKPCVIPIRIVESIWHVYGNFCTPQCSMAYLLSELLDTHTRWERIALLNRLYGKNVNGRLYPAPNRECLQRFGGPISIEDFRSMCESQRTRVDIHLPPMVSILASMDTKPIDFYETPLRNTFTSPYQYTPTKVSDDASALKLKRSKPLKDKESTLDSCLQITIKS